MDLSERDYEAMHGSDSEEIESARSAWFERRPNILAEWQRRLMGKIFNDTEAEIDNPEV